MQKLALAAAALLMLSPAAYADHQEGNHASHSANTIAVGKLDVTDAHLRATPPNAKVAAGYLTIRNGGDEPDRLTGGSADFADKVEVHEMTMDGGVMKMRPLEDGLEIAPGGTAELRPGGYHLMFIGLSDALDEGQTKSVTLTFEKAGTVTLEMPVAALGGGHGHGKSAHQREDTGQ